MKTTKTTMILNCLMLSIPFNALAHPGHAPGNFAAGLSGGEFWSLAGLAGLGLAAVAFGLYRWRNPASADD